MLHLLHQNPKSYSPNTAVTVFVDYKVNRRSRSGEYCWREIVTGAKYLLTVGTVGLKDLGLLPSGHGGDGRRRTELRATQVHDMEPETVSESVRMIAAVQVAERRKVSLSVNAKGWEKTHLSRMEFSSDQQREKLAHLTCQKIPTNFRDYFSSRDEQRAPLSLP